MSVVNYEKLVQDLRRIREALQKETDRGERMKLMMSFQLLSQEIHREVAL